MAWKPTPVSAKPFAWVDTETTGLDSDQHDIIEIAIIRVEDGEETVYYTKVQMDRPENAHPKALEVNGYSEEAWADAQPAFDVFHEIASRKLLNDCIVAGQNVRFDAGFINATFKRHGIKSRMDYHLYDTCTLALEHLRPWVSSISLIPVCVALGIDTEGAHTALADCRMAMAVDAALARATPMHRLLWNYLVPRRLARWEAHKAAAKVAAKAA